MQIPKVEGRYVAELCYTPDLTLRLESSGTLADPSGVDSHAVTAILHGSLLVEVNDEETLIEQVPGGKIHPIMDGLPTYSFIYESCIEQCLVDNGVLALTFNHGTLKVLPFEEVESWQMYDENGFRMICMPGGEIATWNA